MKIAGTNQIEWNYRGPSSSHTPSTALCAKAVSS